MTEQPSLFDAASWQRARFGAWVHHAASADSERRIAQWLHHPSLLWLHSTEPCSGKSHLLYELASSCPHLHVIQTDQGTAAADETATSRVARWLSSLEHASHWAVDLPAGASDPVDGEALFHLIEHARSANVGLLIAWCCADNMLAPAELASRLRMMEQTPIAPPRDDASLAAVLQSAALNLHWDIPESVLRVMLAHTERTLAHQMTVLRRLEWESRAAAVHTTQRWVLENLTET
jgi:chromosomal replication initiation ATPase DnaA